MDMAWRFTRPAPVVESQGGLVFHTGVISDRYCLKDLGIECGCPAFYSHNFSSFAFPGRLNRVEGIRSVNGYVCRLA